MKRIFNFLRRLWNFRTNHNIKSYMTYCEQMNKTLKK